MFVQFDLCSGFLPHPLPPSAVGITAKLWIMCKARTSVQVSLISFASSYGKRNRCHFTTPEIVSTTFVGSYPWSRPARSFPNMAPLLNHNQLSWQCHQKELNSSKTLKKTSVVWSYKLILLMVQTSQGQPPGMVQHLQIHNFIASNTNLSWPQPAHQPDRGEFLHSAPSQSEPGWDQNQCL